MMNHNLRVLYVSFIFLFIHSYSYSQSYNFTNFTIDDGLASNETYEILEDKNGYIWIATDHGISIYDGYDFRTLTVDDGLPNNTVFGFFEDRKGRVWVRSFSGNICYIQNYEVHNILPEKDIGYNISTYVDLADTIWLSSIGHQYKVYLNSEGQYHCEEIENYWLRKIDSTKNGVIVGAYAYAQENFYYLDGKRYQTKHVPREFLNDSVAVYKAYNINNTGICFAKNSHAFFLRPDTLELVSSFPCEHVKMNHLGEELLLGGKNIGFVMDKHFQKKRNFLEGFHITYLTKDREGGYWIATHFNGIFYCSNLEVQAINLGASSRISGMIRNKNNELFAFNYFGGIYKEINGTIKETFEDADSFKLERNEFIRSRFNQSDELIIDMSRSWYNVNTKVSQIRIGSEYQLNERYKAVLINDIMIFDEEKDTLIYSAPLAQRLIHFIPYQDKETLYIPHLQGLYKFDLENKLIDLADRYQQLRKRINAVSVDKLKRLWIATNNDGIYLLDQKKLIHINTLKPNIGKICRNIITNDSYAWASTEKGLVRISLSQYDSIETFTIQDGLISNGIRCIYADGDYILLGHDAGITKFPVEYQKSDANPLIHLDKVLVNNRSIGTKQKYELKHNETHLKISFTGISHNSNIAYKYRLKTEKEDDWKFTSNRTIEFLSIPPGKYRFEVVAVTNGGKESQNPISFDIIVTGPIWLQWWFIALVALLILVSIYLFVKYRLRKMNRKLDLEKKMIDIEQQALRARMSPHFIFNSLNSIQSFILGNDKRVANKYLSEFSKLMRSILENSNKKLIPIRKELSTLEYYLAIENIRFKNKFTYQFIIEEDINLDRFKIPPLLLQPYVENAIWHGIMNKPANDGLLTITLKDMKTHLRFIIEDNGVGRQKANEIKSSQKITHQSAGMEITANRIDLVKTLYDQDFSINVIDLEQDGLAIGTQIEINLPYLN